MMSLQTIRSMSAQQARRSAAQHRGPHIIEFSDDINDLTLKVIPHLGDRTPQGFKKVFLHKLADFDYGYEELFCDSTGWGGDNEPALTKTQLMDKLRDLQVIFPGGFACSISEVGQFQLHIRVMVPNGTRCN